MEEIDFEIIKNYLNLTLSNLKSSFDQETIDAIEHYITHDEFEMAFEGMFLEVMRLKERPLLDYKQSLNIAIQLGLDKESVFDANFWPKFYKYMVMS